MRSQKRPSGFSTKPSGAFSVSSKPSKGRKSEGNEGESAEGGEDYSKYDPKMQKYLSTFDRQYRKLKKQAGVSPKDYKNVQHTAAMYRALLASAINMLPIAEKQFYKYKNESGSYAWIALSNRATDLAAALGSLEDSQAQSTYISSQIVGPSFVLITQQMLTNAALLKSSLDTRGLKGEALRKVKGDIDEYLKSMATYLQVTLGSLEEKVSAYLNGDTPGAAAVKKAKKKKSKKE